MFKNKTKSEIQKKILSNQMKSDNLDVNNVDDVNTYFLSEKLDVDFEGSDPEPMSPIASSSSAIAQVNKPTGDNQVKSVKQNSATNNDKGTTKKVFSEAPFDLAKEFARLSSSYSKADCKEALGLIASMHGLRVVPIGIALKPSESKSETDRKQRKKPGNNQPSLAKACKEDSKMLNLTRERQNTVFNLKQAEKDSDNQKSLITELRKIDASIKERKAELKENIPKLASQKAT